MTTTTTVPAARRSEGPQARPAGVLALTLRYAGAAVLENFRIPMSVIGSLAFPVLALCFFVLPMAEVRENHEFATEAIFSMVVFAFMTNGLFSFGLDVAQRRAKAWGPYLRTLPGRPTAAVAGLVLSTLTFAVLAAIPVFAVGFLFTQARPQPLDAIAAFLVVIVTAVHSALIGLVIGTLCSEKAAIGVTQLVMFTMAFASGLLMPPLMFPQWLEFATRFLPVRAARDLVVQLALGEPAPAWSLPVLALWTVALAVVAVLLVRRDEGRRFR